MFLKYFFFLFSYMFYTALAYWIGFKVFYYRSKICIGLTYLIFAVAFSHLKLIIFQMYIFTISFAANKFLLISSVPLSFLFISCLYQGLYTLVYTALDKFLSSVFFCTYT